MSRKIKVGAHQVTITNQNKILFPADGTTKNDLLIHYTRVAPFMLPLVAQHMITMQRFPDGIDYEGFYQKNMGSYFPRWINAKTISSAEGKKVRYALLNNLESLLYVVNQGCITPHIWLSTAKHMRKPDRMIFDLDPSGTVPFTRVRWLAQELKLLLEARKFTPFVMTTGSRGLHVVVPLVPKATFNIVREYALAVARSLVERYPKYVTLEMSKDRRGNRIFLDVLRNGFAATAVAPYAVRPLSGAPVATPVLWSELSGVTAQKYTIKNMEQRLARVGDVWHNFYHKAVYLF